MKASIDIGTNTVLLLVAELDGNSLTVIDEQQRIPRLGSGVDESKKLSKGAMQRVIDSLNEYRKIVRKKYPEVENIYVTATSAVRDAENKAEFLDLVEQKTGLKVQVLSGLKEAEYTFLGAQSVLNDVEGSKLVIDIGGGSTELAYGQEQLEDRYSYDMGCVRFTERFLKNNPPTDLQIQECRDAIKRVLEEYRFNFPTQTTFIGVAGTVTSLAFIDLKMSSYNSETLSGHIITKKKLQSYINCFSSYTYDMLGKKYPEVMKGRADIFLAGLLILDEFMKWNNIKELITSTGGIRYGTLITETKK